VQFKSVLSLLAFASFFLSTLDSLTVLVISSRFSHAAALNAPTVSHRGLGDDEPIGPRVGAPILG